MYFLFNRTIFANKNCDLGDLFEKWIIEINVYRSKNNVLVLSFLLKVVFLYHLNK